MVKMVNFTLQVFYNNKNDNEVVGGFRKDVKSRTVPPALGST